MKHERIVFPACGEGEPGSAETARSSKNKKSMQRFYIRKRGGREDKYLREKAERQYTKRKDAWHGGIQPLAPSPAATSSGRDRFDYSLEREGEGSWRKALYIPGRKRFREGIPPGEGRFEIRESSAAEKEKRNWQGEFLLEKFNVPGQEKLSPPWARPKNGDNRISSDTRVVLRTGNIRQGTARKVGEREPRPPAS